MAATTDIEKYAAIMKEIKLRTEVINLFLSGARDAHYVPTTVETIGLQFRKLFKLIAFSSLAANRQQYSAVYADVAKHWRAALLLENLERINPDYYPKPVLEIPSVQSGVVNDLKDRERDYLTQRELIIAHKKCGALMHGANPFGKPIDYPVTRRIIRYGAQRSLICLIFIKSTLWVIQAFGFFTCKKKGKVIKYRGIDLMNLYADVISVGLVPSRRGQISH